MTKNQAGRTAPPPTRPSSAFHGQWPHRPQLRQQQTDQQVGFSEHQPILQQTKSGSESSAITGSSSANPGPHTRQDSGTTSTNTGETPPPDASFSQLPVAESSYNSTTAIPRICNCDNCAETERGNELRSRLPLEQCGLVESPMISQLRRRHLQSENYQ